MNSIFKLIIFVKHMTRKNSLLNSVSDVKELNMYFTPRFRSEMGKGDRRVVNSLLVT